MAKNTTRSQEFIMWLLGFLTLFGVGAGLLGAFVFWELEAQVVPVDFEQAAKYMAGTMVCIGIAILIISFLLWRKLEDLIRPLRELHMRHRVPRRSTHNSAQQAE